MSSKFSSNKYKKYSGIDIFPHKHCPVCNKMIPEDQEYCSVECANYNEQKDKGQKKKIFMFVGIYVIAIVAFIVLAFTM